MYIGIVCQLAETFGNENHQPPMRRFFDANTVVQVNDAPMGGVCFVAVQGVYGIAWITDSYTEAGLIELLIQARLHPAEFRPSVNVGKPKADEIGSTGSHHFSAKGKK